jgi:hypothetical protein
MSLTHKGELPVRNEHSDNRETGSLETIGEVAVAALFNDQLLLPPARAKINKGNNVAVNDSYDIRTLVKTNPKTGELEVQYHHSAHIVDLLQGQLGINEVHKAEGRERLERTFLFIDVGGNVYKNMVVLAIQPRKRDRRLEHTAVFTQAGNSDIYNAELEIIAIDDIYGISYTPRNDIEE